MGGYFLADAHKEEIGPLPHRPQTTDTVEAHPVPSLNHPPAGDHRTSRRRRGRVATGTAGRRSRAGRCAASGPPGSQRSSWETATNPGPEGVLRVVRVLRSVRCSTRGRLAAIPLKEGCLAGRAANLLVLTPALTPAQIWMPRWEGMRVGSRSTKAIQCHGPSGTRTQDLGIKRLLAGISACAVWCRCVRPERHPEQSAVV
jgi:hypothetical protein